MDETVRVAEAVDESDGAWRIWPSVSLFLREVWIGVFGTGSWKDTQTPTSFRNVWVGGVPGLVGRGQEGSAGAVTNSLWTDSGDRTGKEPLGPRRLG
jgi:hypothetical protein